MSETTIVRTPRPSCNTAAMKIYLAGPLFTPKQNEQLDKLEGVLGQTDQYMYFSPRHGSGGNLREVEGEERVALGQRIYADNVEQLVDCNIVLVNIDDFDTGTVFEFGYATSLRDNTAQQKIVVTYSPSAYGLNLMLNNSGVEGHFFSLNAVCEFFEKSTAKNLAELKYELRFATFDLKTNKDLERDVD